MRPRLPALMLAATMATGCGDAGTQPVRLEFSLNSSLLACGGGSASGQLGFYVAGLRMVDAHGSVAPVRLAATPTQSVAEGIALVSWNGACARPADELKERDEPAHTTAIANPVVEGRIERSQYSTVEFELGVPFERNHANPLGAPAPLNVPSMFWTWQSGYKFMRLNLGTDWSFHLGSTGCVSASAVRPPGSCAQPNMATIRLPAAAAFEGVVAVDLDALLAGIDIAAADNCVAAYGEMDECRRLLAVLGVDAETGRCIDGCRGQALFRYEHSRL